MLFILVPLAFGVIQFGIIFAQDLGMGNGAREGARYGATDSLLACNDGSSGDLVSRVREASDTVMLDTSRSDADATNIDITISVHVGDFVDADTARASTPVCTNTSTPPASYEEPACDGANIGEDRIYVFTSYQRGLSIPLGPVQPDFEVNGVGVFVCEYS
ncbi:pilus assembly protein [Nitriliruptoria bacterium AS10]|nr:pilus assembly protein [Salsipaludibacter albus]